MIFPLGAALSIPKFPVPGQNLGQKEAPGHQTGNQTLKLYFGSYYLAASVIAARRELTKRSEQLKALH